MDQRQPAVRQLSFYVTSFALVVSAAGLVRTLYQLLSPAGRAPQVGSLAKPHAMALTASETMVSDLDQGQGDGLLVAALFGAVIGAGVALLCAPQSGRESREWIARRTRGIKDRVDVAFDPRPDVIPNGVIPS